MSPAHNIMAENDPALRNLISSIDWESRDGLWTPSEAAAASLPNTSAAYLRLQFGLKDLVGESVPIMILPKLMERASVAQWLSTISLISIVLDNIGVRNCQIPLAELFAKGRMSSGINERIRTFEGGRRQYLFTPHGLEALAKLAITYANQDTPAVEDFNDHFTYTYLATCDYVFESQREEDPFRSVLRVFLREQEHGRSVNSLERLIRSEKLYIDLPQAKSTPLGDTSPAEIFATGLGIQLEVFLSMAFGLSVWFYMLDPSDSESVNRHAAVVPQKLFEKSELDQTVINKFFAHLRMSDDTIENLKSGSIEDPNFFHDLSVLRQHPLYEIQNFYIPISIPLYRWRITEGLFWEINTLAKGQRKDGGFTDDSAFMHAFGVYLQEYIVELLKRSEPAALVTGRTWSEPEGGLGTPSVDVVIEYPDELVAIEIKSARLHYKKCVLEGDIDYFQDQDLEKLLYGPVKQMDRAISALRSGQSNPGMRHYPDEMIYPVLITYSGLPTADPVWRRLLDEIDARNLLRQPGVRPLVVLDVGEAEMLAALRYAGVALPEVLERKVSGEWVGVPFSNFAATVYPHSCTLQDLFKDDSEKVTRLMIGSIGLGN